MTVLGVPSKEDKKDMFTCGSREWVKPTNSVCLTDITCARCILKKLTGEFGFNYVVR